MHLLTTIFLLSLVCFAKPHSKGKFVPLPSQVLNAPPTSITATSSDGLGNAAQRSRDGTTVRKKSDNLIKPPVAFAPVNRCTQKHSLEKFIKISSAYSPQSAPGNGVYFVSDTSEVPQLYYLKASKGAPEQVTSFPDGLTYYEASRSGTKVLLATQLGGDEQYHIHLYDWTKKTITPLLVDKKVRVDSVAWSFKEDWFAFTSNERNGVDFDLYRFDLAKKKPELIAEMAGQNSVTDISPDGNWIAISQFRSVTDSDILLWNLAEKKVSHVRVSGKEQAVSSGKFSANSRNILFVSDEEGGIPHLHRARLANLDIHQLITSGQASVEDLNFNADRSQLALVFNEEGYSRVEAHEVTAAGERGKPIVVPEIPLSVSSSPAFRFGKDSIFISNTSSLAPGEIWELKGPFKTQWTYSTKDPINSACYAKAELIHYSSFDGLEIPAFLFTPNGVQKGDTIPVMMHIHGGPESQYRPSFSRIFQYLLERDFGILAPNVRGSTGYGRQYTLLDNYKKRMDSVKDAIAGAKWITDQGISSKGLLTISGASYGGFMVLRTIEEAPDYFAAASEGVGISDFVSFLKNTKPYRRALREAEYGPLSDESFLKSISPMTHLDKIQTPLLIFHGANDPRVPVSESEQIVQALKKREVTVDAKIFPNEGHGNSHRTNIMEQARLMAFFFDQQVQKNLRGKKKGP